MAARDKVTFLKFKNRAGFIYYNHCIEGLESLNTEEKNEDYSKEDQEEEYYIESKNYESEDQDEDWESE